MNLTGTLPAEDNVSHPDFAVPDAICNGRRLKKLCTAKLIFGHYANSHCHRPRSGLDLINGHRGQCEVRAAFIMTNELNPTLGAVPHADVAAWKEIVARYQKSSTWRALWQIVNTLVPIAALWYLMYLSLSVSWWLLPPLAVLVGAFLVRVFIIFHDCGHGSFFKSPVANDFWGFLSGLLTFTPFHHWRWEHSLHHATSGDLDRRGTGDVWTMTVQEYVESSRGTRFAY